MIWNIVGVTDMCWFYDQYFIEEIKFMTNDYKFFWLWLNGSCCRFVSHEAHDMVSLLIR